MLLGIQQWRVRALLVCLEQHPFPVTFLCDQELHIQITGQGYIAKRNQVSPWLSGQKEGRHSTQCALLGTRVEKENNSSPLQTPNASVQYVQSIHICIRDPKLTECLSSSFARITHVEKEEALKILYNIRILCKSVLEVTLTLHCCNLQSNSIQWLSAHPHFYTRNFHISAVINHKPYGNEHQLISKEGCRLNPT